MNKYLTATILILAFLGFLDSSYLTISHYTGADLNCGELSGCQEVTTSKYSKVFGIPVALGGILYYLSVIGLTVSYISNKKKNYIKALPYLTTIGFLASAWFVYVQLFILHKICIYCMASAVSSTILFIIGLYVLKFYKK